MPESSLKPPKPIITGGCCGGQFWTHELATIERLLGKPWLLLELRLFRMDDDIGLAMRIEQIRAHNSLRVLINLNIHPVEVEPKVGRTDISQ